MHILKQDLGAACMQGLCETCAAAEADAEAWEQPAEAAAAAEAETVAAAVRSPEPASVATRTVCGMHSTSAQNQTPHEH